jgi:hypothetical protein
MSFVAGVDFYQEPDFLTGLEILQIRDQVLDMKDDWKIIIPSDHLFGPSRDLILQLGDAGLGFYNLGDATYLLRCNKQTEADINVDVRDRLFRDFEWLHKKILRKLESITGVETRLLGLTAPGFHISTVPIKIKPSEFHEDFSIWKFRPEVDLQSIYSILLLIEEPTEGAWLEYMDGDKKRLKQWEYGTFHMFRGSMRHRIASYYTKLGEHRITLQCHYFHDKVDNVNWVYF